MVNKKRMIKNGLVIIGSKNRFPKKLLSKLLIPSPFSEGEGRVRVI